MDVGITPFEYSRLLDLADDLLKQEKYVIRDQAWRGTLIENLAIHCISIATSDAKLVKEVMWKLIPQFLTGKDLLAKPSLFN